VPFTGLGQGASLHVLPFQFISSVFCLSLIHI